MKKIGKIVLVFIAFLMFVNAKEYNLVYDKIHGKDALTLYDHLLDDDFSTVLVGGNHNDDTGLPGGYIAKNDKKGNKVFEDIQEVDEETITFISLTKLNNHYYALANRSNNCYLYKYDLKGNKVYDKKLDFGDSPFCYPVDIKAADNSLVTTGSVFVTENGRPSQKAFVRVVNEEGEKIWEDLPTGSKRYYNYILTFKDSIVLFLGNPGDVSTIVKYSKDGVKQKEKDYNNIVFDTNKSAIIELEDGGFLGSFPVMGEEYTLAHIRFNKDLEIEWMRKNELLSLNFGKKEDSYFYFAFCDPDAENPLLCLEESKILDGSVVEKHMLNGFKGSGDDFSRAMFRLRVKDNAVSFIGAHNFTGGREIGFNAYLEYEKPKEDEDLAVKNPETGIKTNLVLLVIFTILSLILLKKYSKRNV